MPKILDCIKKFIGKYPSSDISNDVSPFITSGSVADNVLDALRIASQERKEWCRNNNEEFFGVYTREILVKLIWADPNDKNDKRILHEDIERLIENGDVKFIHTGPSLNFFLPEDYDEFMQNKVRSNSQNSD